MAAEVPLFDLPHRNALPAHGPEQTEDVGEYGAVFTKRWIVEHILDLAGYTADENLASLRAVEPACGEGAFLLPMVERLLASCAQRQTPLSHAVDAIRSFDLLRENVTKTSVSLHRLLARHCVDADLASTLVENWISHEDYLLSSQRRQDVDFVVGNPPYVRLEAVPPGRQERYRRELSTMSGRADIFVGFYERALRSLGESGVLAFICADRWMRNSYGRHLRALVARDFSIEFVLNAHDVDAFEETVSAYPAITVIRRRTQDGAIIADANASFGPADAAILTKWSASDEITGIETPGVSAARLLKWFDGDQSWPTGTPARLAVLSDLESRFAPLEDPATRTKVGIGVATGADAVFVSKPAPDVEGSRCLPLAMSSDIRSGNLRWSGHYLVNPWDEFGLVELNDYPLLEKYYNRNSQRLLDRNIAKRQPRWYRTIDRVNDSLTGKPKLLFADMSSRIWPVLDEGCLYPHHNLYWITSDTWDLKVLGGLLLSDVAELFVSSYCVRMRGGTLRFQAQYLRRIRVPAYSSIPTWARYELSSAFAERDVDRCSDIAGELYGVDLKSSAGRG